MQGRYAVLGWGSLIWDLEVLAPHVDLPWKMEHGPHLPMEFSRISPKRKMGLAVCLDHDAGEACPTHAIPSRRASAAEVAQDLADRERSPLEMIGVVCLATGTAHGRPEIAEIISGWCAEHGWEGAVWTDLRSNFTEMSGQAFSFETAVAHLRTLSDEQLEEAVRYMSCAPRGTDTPLRRALLKDPWWRAEMARFGFSDLSEVIT
ncbi:MAG: hypothetical protein AAGD13_21560 [Pseudomonadota bacterium]